VVGARRFRQQPLQHAGFGTLEQAVEAFEVEQQWPLAQQALSQQAALPPQLLEQLPQWLAFEVRSVHSPLQQVGVVLAHGFVQLPQWLGFEDRSAHKPLQQASVPQLTVLPQAVPQVAGAVKLVQVPLQQVSPLGQAFPHEPQLESSVLVLTHAPLQQVALPVQAVNGTDAVQEPQGTAEGLFRSV
jgi:hypothetical protein